jgi:glycosyltransferase involved in cell wall biosynthesis
MIHEIFTDKFPNNDYTSIYKKNSVERADHIICISESTKSDLINVFNIDEKKISVTHLGVSSLVTTLDRYSLVKKHHNPYILYVGNRWGHKNFNRLIKAFASSKNLVKDFDVVSFGGNKFNDNELALFNKLGLKDKVFHYVGDDMCLSEFYNQANIFVYPSLYEGFGLPPLEAMVNNCAVASSNTSSMPEVIGNAGEFFDPYDLDDIKQAIENVVYSNKRTNELLSFGIKRASEFTWEKCAEETLNVYKKYL